jgi:hypothetical protein
MWKKNYNGKWRIQLKVEVGIQLKMEVGGSDEIGSWGFT